MNSLSGDTFYQIMNSWYETVETACIRNGLDKETVMQMHETGQELPQDTIFEESLGITPVFDDTEAVVCRELRYKGLVLARMTRTGYVYKFEGFVFEEGAIAQIPIESTESQG